MLGLITACYIVSFQNKNKVALRRLILSSFLCLYLSSIHPVSNKLSFFLEKKYLLSIDQKNIDKIDMVVVLGASLIGNQYLNETLLSKQGASRLLHAIQVFRKNDSKYFICCGKGAFNPTEAEVLAINAQRLGVPKDKIKIDPNSKNTREHAIEVNKIFSNKKHRIGLVTSAYHMKRSEREFAKYFNNIVPLPSDYLYTYPSSLVSLFTFFPNSNCLYKSCVAFREIIGFMWYSIRKL